MTYWQSLKITILGWLGYIILGTINKSLRWVRNDLESYPDGGQSRIYAIWHGRVLMSAFAYCNFYNGKLPRPFYVLVSKHFDGQLIGNVLRRVGLGTVSGSSTRGGAIGMRGLIKVLRDGSDAAIMPDGPRGPKYEVKAGTIKVAGEADALIYPTAFGFERAWKFNSWDGMLLPKPFSRAVLILGSPISIPKQLNEETLKEWKDRLKIQMMKTLDEADSYEFA